MRTVSIVNCLGFLVFAVCIIYAVYVTGSGLPLWAFLLTPTFETRPNCACAEGVKSTTATSPLGHDQPNP